MSSKPARAGDNVGTGKGDVMRKVLMGVAFAAALGTSVCAWAAGVTTYCVDMGEYWKCVSGGRPYAIFD